MIALVALDADDTLWHNEPLYTTTREQFRTLLDRYSPVGVLDERLYEVELGNLQHFGYGVKGFVLSLIETAIELTEGRVESADLRTIIGWGRDMLCSPVELLDGVLDVVEQLAGVYPIILVTKGDLLHQESKLARSGLGPLFTGIEIVSEKDARVYRTIMTRYAVAPEHFVMVGNSLRSDILPVLEAGGHAVYVPYESSWVHERVAPEAMSEAQYHQIDHIRELPALLERLGGREPPGNETATTLVAHDVRGEIEEIVHRETRAWDRQDVDLLLSVLHPDLVWPWPPHPRAHDPMEWVFVLGRHDRDRWRRVWQQLFDTHTLVHNRRTIRRIEISAERDGAFAVVDVDTLWRSRAGVDERWQGRACKIYTRTGSGWKMIAQTGLLQYGARYDTIGDTFVRGVSDQDPA